MLIYPCSRHKCKLSKIYIIYHASKTMQSEPPNNIGSSEQHESGDVTVAPTITTSFCLTKSKPHRVSFH